MLVKDIILSRHKTKRFTVHRDLEYLDGLCLDLYQSHQSKPSAVIIFFYGKEWNTGRKSNYATLGKTLALAGYTTLIPDISSYPKATATEMQVQILMAIKWAQTQCSQYNSNPDDITIIGYGRGAQLVTNVIFKNAIRAAQYHYHHSSDDLTIEVPKDPSGIDLSNCKLICQDGIYNLQDLYDYERERGIEDLTLTDRLFGNDYCSPVDTLLDGSREHPNDILAKHLPNCFVFLEQKMDPALLELLEYVGVLDVSWLRCEDYVYACRMGHKVLGDYVTRIRHRSMELDRYKRWSVIEKVADLDDRDR